MSDMKKIAIIGDGITGLSSAFWLLRNTNQYHVILLIFNSKLVKIAFRNFRFCFKLIY